MIKLLKSLILIAFLPQLLNAATTWSGFFVYPNGGNKITAVSGTYKVPAFKLNSNGSAYIWPGIGGLTSFQQSGTCCIVKKGVQWNYTWFYELSDAHSAYWVWLMNGNTYELSMSALGNWVTASVEITGSAGQYHVVSTVTNGTSTWIAETDDSLFTGATGEWMYELSTGKPILAEPLQFTECKFQVNNQPTWYYIGQYCPYAVTGNWHDSGGAMATDGIGPNGSFIIKNK